MIDVAKYVEAKVANYKERTGTTCPVSAHVQLLLENETYRPDIVEEVRTSFGYELYWVERFLPGCQWWVLGSAASHAMSYIPTYGVLYLLVAGPKEGSRTKYHRRSNWYRKHPKYIPRRVKIIFWNPDKLEDLLNLCWTIEPEGRVILSREGLLWDWAGLPFHYADERRVTIKDGKSPIAPIIFVRKPKMSIQQHYILNEMCRQPIAGIGYLETNPISLYHKALLELLYKCVEN